MDLGDSVSTVGVLELGDLQGRLHDFQLPPHPMTWEDLQGKMAAFISEAWTSEIGHVDMDDTAGEEVFPGNDGEVPPGIAKGLRTIDKELPLAREEEKILVGEEELYPAKDEEVVTQCCKNVKDFERKKSERQ
ncbi:unnamed protein product [Calypogeia fissa]